ncbi:MAG: hypothetical protein IJ828_02125 [Treponema sp.]|nr:hypothetical protein [Treponema sp.]
MNTISPQNDFPEWSSIFHLSSQSAVKKAFADNILYIHDIAGSSYYKISWSLEKLIENGISTKNEISVRPASDFATLLQHIETVINHIQQECSGIQEIQSFDTFVAPYIKNSNLTDTEIFHLLYNFISAINMQTQAANASCCIHFGFDWTCPPHLRNKKAILGDSEQQYTYRECQDEMDILNKQFLAVLERGDCAGRGFAYTIPEYALDNNYNWNGKNTSVLWKVTEKYGLPVFKKRDSGHTPHVSVIKSVAVLNLPLLAYQSPSESIFFEKLDSLFSVTKEAFSGRNCITRYAKQFLDSKCQNGDAVIPCGLHECCLNLINESIATPEGKALAEKILKHIQDSTPFAIENNYINPVHFLFAQKDSELYEGIKHSGNAFAYYTCGTSLPADTEFDLFTAVKHHESFAYMYDSDSPLNLYTGNQIKDWQTCKSIAKRIIAHHDIPSFTFSPTYSICLEHGHFQGNHAVCPVCSAQTEQYARIAHCFQPLDSFTEAQKEEVLKQIPLATENQPSLFHDFMYELFTSKNCKKCPPVQQYISTKQMQGTEISVDTKKGLDIAAERGVFMTPTVILYVAQNKEVARLHTIDEIDAFLSYQGISTGASSSSALLS